MQFPFNKSRVDRIKSVQIGNGFEFDMLRDDLIHPIVSGNKWRKLKYIIQHAQDKKFQKIVTFGGAYSNHLVATAFVGNVFNIKTTAFIRGDEERPLNHYENLCIENHMNLIKVSRTDYKNKESLYSKHFENDENTLFINEGGEHPLALIGCIEILDEIENKYDIIILSMGTGTTMEGLVKGINEKHFNTKVFGISSLKNNFDLDIKLKQYDENSYKVFHEFHRGKYGKIDSQLVDFIKNFYLETGIKTDVVYTGKMLMALDQLIKNGNINSSHKVLCIHTGGLLAFPN
jgi:1-aminocyclopropane-1-carboxylate deaminase